MDYYYNVDVNVYSEYEIKNINTKMINKNIIITKINDYNYNIKLDPSMLHIPNEDFVLEYQLSENDFKKNINDNFANLILSPCIEPDLSITNIKLPLNSSNILSSSILILLIFEGINL